MPKKGSIDIRCSVQDCDCEWIKVSKKKYYYCDFHTIQANELYNTYKTLNAEAITTFDDETIRQVISLRKEYAKHFIGYINNGHQYYINILEKVLSLEQDQTLRQKIYNKLLENQLRE